MCGEHETSDIIYPMRPNSPARRQTNSPLDMLSLVCRTRRRAACRMEVFVHFLDESSILLPSSKCHGDYEDDEVVAAALALAAAPRPLRAEPVTRLLVSLLLRPVGCRSCRGILNLPKYFPATIGPMINAMKMMNMKK